MAGEIYLVGAVRGLESEGKMVAEAIDDVKPDIIGLSISKESLQAMAEHFENGSELPEPANFEEEMYTVDEDMPIDEQGFIQGYMGD